MNDLILWVWLSTRCPPDTPAFSIVYRALGNVERIYQADEEQLLGIRGLTKKNIEALSDKNTAQAFDIIKQCQRSNIGIITYEDELFPSRLRIIKNPPVLLYYKGKLPEFDKEVCIGTVGTRNPTSYGCRCAYEIAFDLAINGAYVISGMAFGIDAVCHKAALDAGGRTVAVLGCGVDVVYPSENEEIYQRLLLNGTIVSEYAPGSKATRYSFPQRNRIISGLSLGTLIIEAQLKSGAMITARRTLEQERDLYTIPGRVGEFNSLGPNSLIQAGAKSVSSAADILCEYEFLYPDKIRRSGVDMSAKNNPFKAHSTPLNMSVRPKRPMIPKDVTADPEDDIPEQDVNEHVISYDGLSEEQISIVKVLSKSAPLSLEEICRFTNISVSDTMSSLTILEIQGIVKAVPGGSYLLA